MITMLKSDDNRQVMKRKEFDDFSFKAPSSKRSESEGSIKDLPPPKVIKPSDIKFRHPQQPPKVHLFNTAVNEKITKISDDLQENIKRRIQLQKKLEAVRSQEQRREEKKIFLAYSHNLYKEPQEVIEKFKKIEGKADKIDQLLNEKSEPATEERRLRQIEKNKTILLEEIPQVQNEKQKIIMPIIQTLSAQKTKPLPVYTIPDQIKIQRLLRKVTFPETPTENLQKLRKEVESLYAVHQPHSDIHYLLMMIYYHEQKYLKVRKHFQDIQLFKVFNIKVYWIAAQSQFGLQNYELCLKLTQECMNKLEDKYLPRFVYLKAKSYEKIDNYINSIVCYNQLIKIKPKISEYFLERGILYHRIGYYKEAKQDFVMFGILNPNAEHLIKEKILAEQNQIRRKQYIAILAKMY